MCQTKSDQPEIPHLHRSLIFNNNMARAMLLSTRPWSFTASVTPVLLGTALAWKTSGNFSVVVFILTVVVVVSVHSAGNLMNTLYDFWNGVDNKNSDDLTLINGLLSDQQVQKLSLVLYLIATVLLVVTSCLSQAHAWVLYTLFSLGVGTSFFYTGGVGLKYVGFGDVLILMTFGPLTAGFAHVTQCGTLTWEIVPYTVPLALSVEAILHSNNTRDMESDQQAGITTLAIKLGERNSRLFYFLLLFLPYFILALFTSIKSCWFLLPLLTAPMTNNLRVLCQEDALKSIPQETAKWNLVFGVLYTLSCILA